MFLAQAGIRLTEHTALPTGLRAVLVHGDGDAVIPVDDSRRLAAGGAGAVYVEVHDDHRLKAVTQSGMLTALVRLARTLPVSVAG